MRKFALTIITKDRAPRDNYLKATLENLLRSGALVSRHFHSLHIADGGGSESWPDRVLNELSWSCRDSQEPSVFMPAPGSRRPQIVVHRTLLPRTSRDNAIAVVEAAIKTKAPWILFMEDDLDFCGDFLESVNNWLRIYATPEHFVFPFGAPYIPQVQIRAQQRKFTWNYPVTDFYGSQCLAIRHEHAQSLVDYWRTATQLPNDVNDTAIDIHIANWHKEVFPQQPYMLASAPSFVQHMGRASIATNKEATHKFLWLGPFWAFESGVVRV